jgi:hypothetical protein
MHEHHYLLWIGDSPTIRKNPFNVVHPQPFVVEVTHEEFMRMRTKSAALNNCFPAFFYGKVVMSKLACRPVGENGRFCNPYFEIAESGYCWPGFVKIAKPAELC